jgi:Protein of unknown function (DUF3159)
VATDSVNPGDVGSVLTDVEVPTVEALIRHRLSTVLGGWRGSLETTLPMLAFVLSWSWRHDATTSLVAAGVVTMALALVRLAQRQSAHFVLGAALATGVAAFFVLRSGRAEDAFLPGLIKSTAFGVGALISVALRWPVVGFMVSAGDPYLAEDPLGWRRDRGLVRVCQRLTMVLVVLYAVRLAVMLPLYLASKVAWLSVASVVLGWPLWLAAVGVMAAILLRGHTPQQSPGRLLTGEWASMESNHSTESDDPTESGHSAPRGTR